MPIRTRLRKLFELPGEKFMQLLSWANSPLADDQKTLVAEALDSHGQTLAYISARKILLLDGYAVNPLASLEQAQSAGDAVDITLANVALQDGISSMLVTVPEGAPRQPGEITLRFVERTVAPQYEATQLDAQSPSAYIN